MKSKLKKGDQVFVITGKDKGREGTILEIVKPRTKKGRPNKKGLRAIVEGINIVKKTVKANPQANQPGGIVQKEASVDLSNLAIKNTSTGLRDSIAFKILENGKKVRTFKKTGEVVDL